ncbi:MAG: substrate-binding domain-containing protein [Phycisphaerae bacterium]
MPQQSGFHSLILEGMLRYIRPAHRWRLVGRGAFPGIVERLADVELDGVLGHLSHMDVAEELMGLGVPVVNTSGRTPGRGTVHLGIDEAAVGRMAAEHLMGLGLTQFAVLGSVRIPFSAERGDAFAESCGKCAQADVHRFYLDVADPFDPCSEAIREQSDDRVTEWLERLPKPVGLLVTDPGYADRTADLCRIAKIAVPEEIAMIAGHQNDIIAKLSWPPISSVQLPLRKLGYLAAAALDDLMHGRSPEASQVLKPVGVSVRKSSDVIAMADSRLAKAVAMIREEACLGLSVEDVLDRLEISRSLLDRLFREVLGRTTFAEIRRVQIETAKQLLAETDKTMDKIALQCGFSGPVRFSSAFKHECGLSPSDWRRQFRYD